MSEKSSPFINTPGFTLIEVLIAMAIFSVGILALYTMQLTAIRGNSTANHIGVAMSVLNSQIESLMNDSYAGSNLSSGNHTSSASLPSGVQSCRWVVTEWTTSDGIDNDSDSATDEIDEQNIKSINITVTYNNYDKAKSINTKLIKIN